jgi:alcohol dehydrogenase class IV
MGIFHVKTEIYSGIGVQKVLEKENLKKIMIITDHLMVSLGLAKIIEEALSELKIEYDIFDEVEVDPSLESIKKGLEKVMDFSPEKIIALGGGSAIDTAKAIYYFMRNSGKEIPIIAIPTTSGTGSEVTSYAVITDKKKKVKIPIKDENMIPEKAILDPQFTKTLPKVVVADGGIDALTHAIESYTCKSANFYTQTFALTAIVGIFKNILKVYNDIGDEDGRIEMGKASCMAGIAFDRSGLGINHSVAHVIGGRFHKSHGRSNGVVLPYIIKFNSSDKETAKRYWEISKRLGLPSKTKEQGAESLSIAVEVLNRHLGIPSCLRDMGIGEDEYKELIPLMAKTAFEDICTQGNVKEVSQRDMEEIFQMIY